MLDGVVFIRASEPQTYAASALPAPRRLNGRRTAGYIAVTGLGFAIGYILGVVIALMSGLIMLC